MPFLPRWHSLVYAVEEDEDTGGADTVEEVTKDLTSLCIAEIIEGAKVLEEGSVLKRDLLHDLLSRIPRL